MVTVVPGGREQPHPVAHLAIGEHLAHEPGKLRMRDLRGEEVEKAVQLLGVAPHRRRELGRVDVGRLDGPHLHLKTAVEPLDPPEDAHGVALGEASVEQLDVVPHTALDPPARVDELDCEVRLTVASRQLALAGNRVDPVDGAILDELRDRRHGLSLGVG